MNAHIFYITPPDATPLQRHLSRRLANLLELHLRNRASARLCTRLPAIGRAIDVVRARIAATRVERLAA